MFSYYLLGISVFFAILGLIWQYWPTRNLIRKNIKSRYDFVIVGAGSAGCVLADRLTQDGKFHVLLIEAGDEEINTPMFEIPFAAMDQQGSTHDWAYKTVPQNHSCLGLVNNQSAWPTGKGLGGSSNLNYMIYTRGSHHDYNKWAENWCKGWSFADVLPYFIKAESNRNSRFSENTAYHGTLGPTIVSDVTVRPKLAGTFLQAGTELGHPITDVNAGSQMGVMHAQATIVWGKRWSTAQAYLRPAMTRKNLHVITNAHVTKLIIKGTLVTGVEFIRNNTLQTVKIRREVILSAGTIGSAKLLMLSGIGPKKHLDSLGIPVVADLPVGDNLQDHITTDAVSAFIREPISIIDQQSKSLWPILDYMLFGQGALSSPVGTEGLGFFRSAHQPQSDKFPHLQLNFRGLLIGSTRKRHKINQNKLNIKADVYKALHKGMDEEHGVTIMPVLLHPKSRGTVRLNTSNYLVPPVIDPNYLAHPDDVKTLVDGIRLAESFLKTKAFRIMGAKFLDREHPLCKHHKFKSDEYWSCYVQHNTMTAYEPIGTCKMGPANDPTTVVDTKLRVKGVNSLRVVDGSVMPNITSGNTEAPIIMMAEKAADLILQRISVIKKKKVPTATLR